MRPVDLRQKLKHEFRALAAAALYFGFWIAALIVLKQLILAEYHIEFHGLSKAVIGALVLSKVVVVLEHVPLGRWVRVRPAWVDIILRTTLYGFGLLVVLILEKAFEGRHEYGGFGPSLSAVFHHVDIHHVWTTSFALTGALLGYNVLSVVRGHLGKGGLARVFMTPVPDWVGSDQPALPAKR